MFSWKLRPVAKRWGGGHIECASMKTGNFGHFPQILLINLLHSFVWYYIDKESGVDPYIYWSLLSSFNSAPPPEIEDRYGHESNACQEHRCLLLYAGVDPEIGHGG